MSQHQVGITGEELAARYLEGLGYRVLTRRFRAGHQEIDLIVQKHGRLCFVEVKYRPDGRLGSGMVAINAGKRKHMRAAILEYLKQNPRPYQVGYLEITRAGILFYPDVLWRD